MKIAIDETIINAIIELLEELAREKDERMNRITGIPNSEMTTRSAIQMREIARMLKEQLSSEHQHE